VVGEGINFGAPECALDERLDSPCALSVLGERLDLRDGVFKVKHDVAEGILDEIQGGTAQDTLTMLEVEDDPAPAVNARRSYGTVQVKSHPACERGGKRFVDSVFPPRKGWTAGVVLKVFLIPASPCR
jgi:hypothetical protein